MNSITTLILGSSYAALGIAAQCPDVLILEATESVGSDYHATLRPSSGCWDAVIDAGDKLLRFLDSYSVIGDTLRLSTVINRWAQLQQIPILLNARLVSIERKDDMYQVTCMTNSGLRTFLAGQIVDTTARRISHRSAASVTEKRLHVICTAPSPERVSEICKQHPSAAITPNGVNDEYTVSFSWPPEISLPQARLSIENCWKQAFPNGEVLIDAVGFDYDIISSSLEDTNIPWLNPHAYSNPVQAYDAGAAWAQEGGCDR